MGILMSKRLATAMIIGSTFLGASLASAEGQALTNLNAQYGTSLTSCSLCHSNAPSLSVFGTDFLSANGTKAGGYAPNWTTLDAGDADNDGSLNGAELAAGTDPNLAPGQVAATTEKASVTGCITGSASTPLMMFLAMRAIDFLAGRKKD